MEDKDETVMPSGLEPSKAPVSEKKSQLVWQAFGLPESTAVRFYPSKDPATGRRGLLTAEKRAIVNASGKCSAWRKRHRLRESDLRHKENRAARRHPAALTTHDIKDRE